MLKKLLSLLLAAVTAILSMTAAAQETALYDENTAYVLNPPVLPEEPATEHEFINILMLGVDFGVRTPGKGKKNIKNCHTDSVIMIAVDVTANKINLISIPRDTMTYVPGVYGIYKLNAALNCAPSFDEGIQTAQDTVSWLLGGIRPDHYLVITPHFVEEIGNRIGGLDIDVEMNYTGHSGTAYSKGLQHLDGVGIMDYARARRNATRNNNDYGRTSRQRTVLNTLFHKVTEDLDLIYDMLDVIVENFDEWFYSDLSAADLFSMVSLAETLSTGDISNYELTGDLGMAMKYFTSNFFDQQKRQDTLKEIYGVEIPKQRLNSRGYFNYLYKTGFASVKAVRICTHIIDWAKGAGYDGDLLEKAAEAQKALADQISALDDKLDIHVINRIEKQTRALKVAVRDLRDACGYPEKLDWSIVQKDKWYLDPDINQYNNIDWN